MKQKKSGDLSAFEALVNAQFESYRKGFDPGEMVDAVVLSVQGQTVACDVKAKREAIIPAEEFTDENGALTVKVGDVVRLRFLGMQDGTFLFTSKASTVAPVADRGLSEAFNLRQPVEGVVQKEVNGGYEVTVAGKRAFCPFSQMALFKKEGEDYIGRKMAFLITEYGEDDRGTNLIISRRELLEDEREEQRQALFAELVPNQIRKGTVTRFADFGVFVDLGGAEGLIPLREIAWQRDVKPQDVLKEGDAVDVMVLSIDEEAGRVSLSLRAVQGDPWDQVLEQHPVGSVLTGTITRIEKFGAFAQIVPGVEGLISIGRLGGGRRLISAREVVKEGQELELQVESVDFAKRRIALKPLDRRIAELKPGELAVGVEVEGIVESIRPFGIFVRLSEEQTGLLHISETQVPKQGSPVAQLERRFAPASKIKVIVKSLEGDRISLTLPETWAAQGTEEAQEDWRASVKPSESLGSLGDMLNKLTFD